MYDDDVTACQSLAEGIRAVTEELSLAASPIAVADTLADVTVAVPGIEGTAVYLFDRTDRTLRKSAATIDCSGDPVLSDALASVARDAYLAGEPVVGDELPVAAGGDASGTVTARPLGDYGAIVAISSDDGTFDDHASALLSSLATTAKGQLERVESERTLQRYTREHDRCTDSLNRFGDVTDLIFGLERAVTAAESQSALEGTVCERLASLDWVAFAWIGRSDPDEERIVPVASAGREREYLDSVDRTLTSSNSEPAVVAARERETNTVADVTNGLRTASWRREALARDIQSVRAVPLFVADRFDGVLAVYTTDGSATADLWRQTIEHVGTVLARGLGSFARKRALLSDAVVELELQLAGGDDIFGRIARAVETDVRFDGVTVRDDRLVLFLATADCDGRATESTIARDQAVLSVDQVGRSDETLFEVVVRDEWLLSHFAGTGVTPRSIEATGDETRVVLTLPMGADVTGFVESLERRYDLVTLRSRRERPGPVACQQYVWAELEESLTDRQLEILRAAFRSGYFEWPRESTGKEVAESLEISQPTFSRHLRIAERKLLALLFASDKE